jgi:hypothetical protein
VLFFADLNVFRRRKVPWAIDAFHCILLLKLEKCKYCNLIMYCYVVEMKVKYINDYKFFY